LWVLINPKCKGNLLTGAFEKKAASNITKQNSDFSTSLRNRDRMVEPSLFAGKRLSLVSGFLEYPHQLGQQICQQNEPTVVDHAGMIDAASELENRKSPGGSKYCCRGRAEAPIGRISSGQVEF
jgi:hypothetical protein